MNKLKTRFQNGMKKPVVKLLFYCWVSGIVGISTHAQPVEAVESYKAWWESTFEKDLSVQTFQDWLGDLDAESRVHMRAYLKTMLYQSMLDIPCGMCIDYLGLQRDKVDVDYLGVDVTPKLISRAQKLSVPVMLGNIEDLSLQDGQFEFVYARHILEHLPSYQKALKELIRVSSKEVYVVFFRKPLFQNNDITDSVVDHGCMLYHNEYSRPRMEKFLSLQEKVSSFFWEDVNEDEIVLHVFMDK